MREQDLFMYINEIIQIYSSKYLDILHRSSRMTLSVESSQYVTTTNIAPHDFFNHDVNKCSKDISYKDFGDPIIIFNDLKGSTKILQQLEVLGKECLYIAYIKYSSEMLSKVLDLFDGKVIEITGDGNYSIIEKGYLSPEIKNIKRYLKLDNEYTEYLKLFGENEYPDEDTSKTFSILKGLLHKNDEDNLRYFLFILFAIFNIKINNELKKLRNLQSIQFATRVGCKQGECKIVRIEIDKHVCQDKLIGSIVHQAAHQAAGK